MSEQNEKVEAIIGEDTSIVQDNLSEENRDHHRHHGHRHHHHGHRHHHRSHKSKTTNNKNNKFLKFLKKNRSIIINIIACLISAILLILLAAKSDDSKAGTTDDNVTNITHSSVGVEASVYLEDVKLVNDAIITYISKDNNKSAHDLYGMYNGYNTDLNCGLPLRFSYRVTSLPSNVSVDYALLEISMDSAFKNTQQYELDTDSAGIDIYHLKTGTKYYYSLNLTLSNKKVVTTSGEFNTFNSPRILSIDGIANVRDIGGWQTTNGKVIAQGLLYRGSELDGAVHSEYKLTETGKKDMLATLGVKFDMDLRSETENKTGVNALGSNVEHKYYPILAYNGIFEKDRSDIIRDVFADLADESNYPIYMHCTYGSDRTGTVCYLLEALLGVTEDDLGRDYELSAFTESYVNTQEFTAFRARIESLEGNTTQEKVENYLLSIGVTAEQISNIRNIFLTDK